MKSKKKGERKTTQFKRKSRHFFWGVVGERRGGGEWRVRVGGLESRRSSIAQRGRAGRQGALRERERKRDPAPPPLFFCIFRWRSFDSKKKKNNKTTSPDGTVRVAAVAKSCAKPYINGRGGGGGEVSKQPKKAKPNENLDWGWGSEPFFFFFFDWTTTI